MSKTDQVEASTRSYSNPWVLSNPVGKALWFIESHFADEISLDDIARVSCVSRFHLARAFGIATGMPVIGYLRVRRLTEAAKALANGAPDILAVALSVGYGRTKRLPAPFEISSAERPKQSALKAIWPISRWCKRCA